MQDPTSTPMGGLPQGTMLYDQRFRLDVMLEANTGRAIYRAWDTVLNQPATLLEVYTPQPQRIEPALAKAIPLVQLEHPAISPIEVIFTQQDRLFIALSIPGGQTIARVMRERTTPIPPAAALRWMAQIADALTFFAQPPLGWHLGDISPSALLVTAADRVQIVGIEIALGIQLPQQVAASLPLGAVAPELQTGLCDARSDVYSLAATLFLLLTNQRWQGDHSPSLAQLRPDLPAPLIATIAHALSTDRSERWDDAALFYQRLRQSLPATRTDVMNTWWSTPIVTQDELDDEPPTLNIQRSALAAAVAAEAARVAAEKSQVGVPTEVPSPVPESAPLPVAEVPLSLATPAILPAIEPPLAPIAAPTSPVTASITPAPMTEIPLSEIVAILPLAEPVPTHAATTEPTADVIDDEPTEELTYVDIQPLLTDQEMDSDSAMPVAAALPLPLLAVGAVALPIAAAVVHHVTAAPDPPPDTPAPALELVSLPESAVVVPPQYPEPAPPSVMIAPTDWHQATTISSHQQAEVPPPLLPPRNDEPALAGVPTHATPLGFLRTLLRMPPSLTTPATATVVFPTFMYPQQSYQLLFRVQCKPLLRERLAHVAIVDVATETKVFFLPIRKLALHLPLEGGVSEGTMPITVMQHTNLDEIDRVIFTFRDEHGTILHQGQFIADIKILSPQQATYGDDHTSLIHVLDVSHLIPPAT